MNDELTAVPTSTTLRDEVYKFVTSRIHGLYESRDRGDTKATLAHLRAAVASKPGTDSKIWDIAFEDAPGAGRSDHPSPSENAIHNALTLYARHQQSREERAHQSGQGLGVVVRRLSQQSGQSGESEGGTRSAVRRRFDALVAATTYDALIYHLRSLISQLRSHRGLPLDYGQLAVDLLQWQDPRYRNAVKLRWARGYHNTRAENQKTNSETTNN